MPLYSYKAARPGGEVVEGELEAPDEASLIRQLQDQGLLPIRARRADRGLRGLLRRRGPRIDAEQVLHFTRELATLLEAGLTLDRALAILADLADEAALKGVIEGVREKVQGGDSLSAALAAQGKVFSPLYLSMVRAGEAGGVLHQVLQRLADYLERSHELRESIRSALIYPTILLVVAGLSVAGLLIFVVPRFSQMFEEMGQTLPLATRIVVAAGDFLGHWWWALLAGALLLVAWIKARLERPEVRARWDARVLRWPLVGGLVARVETARLARTLATLLGNGLPLLQALDLAREVVGNQAIAAALAQVSEEMRRGRGLAEPLAEADVLPPLALQMIQVGEESGELETMLFKVADVFDQEVRAAVKRLLTLLEPVLIVGLGVLVAGIIVSILMAVLSANQLAF